MDKINKQVKKPRFTNKKYILLGTRKEDNKPIWLVQASWDCGWYYGFGYLEVINQIGSDIDEHYHFEHFFDGKQGAYDEFHKEMSACVLEDNKIWELIDMMKSFTTLKSMAEIYHLGSSHYTYVKEPNLKNDEKYKMILGGSEKNNFVRNEIIIR